jgi:hypothetical protein
MVGETLTTTVGETLTTTIYRHWALLCAYVDVIMSMQLDESSTRTLRLWATREAAVMRWIAYRRLVSCPMRVSSAAASSARSVSSSSACHASRNQCQTVS